MDKAPTRLVYISDAMFGNKEHYRLNVQDIKKCLEPPGVKNLNIAVVSVFGKGSSVIFDLLLKYAIHRYKEGNVSEYDWYPAGDDGLSKNESTADEARTVNMYPEIFICDTSTGGKVGLFFINAERNLTLQELASTFAINVLSSSLHIQHFMRRISEEDLQQMELFCAFANYLQQGADNCKPFQKLMYLVRGWELPVQYKFGVEGGQRYLKESVFFNPWLAPRHHKTRQNILSKFEEMTCFLMTDSTCGVPGRGSGSSDENLFREHVKMLIPSLLEPENLILKRINGELVTAEKLFELMGSWVDKLNGFDLPDVSTLYRPSLQADNSMIEKAALELYVSRMDNAGCVDNDYVDPVILESWHEKALFVAMQFFKERHEYDSSLTKNYKMELIDSMIIKYREIRDENYRRYKDYSPLMWVPVFSFALITISILTSKRHPTNTEDSSLLHWAVPLSFWLGVTGLFHWGQLVYEFIEFEALKCVIRRAVIAGMIAYLLYNVYLSLTLAKVK